MDRRVTDDVLWSFCQANDIVLVTGNRNSHDATSLEATIVRVGKATSLPVLTFADPRRIRTDRVYAERVAVRLMEVLSQLDQSRGAGRLWLP